MKKIILTFAVVVFCAGLNAYGAQGYVFTPENTKAVVSYNESLQLKNIPYGNYLKYYNFNSDKIDAEYVKLSGNEEKNFLKTLSKTQEEDYKYVKKSKNLLKKAIGTRFLKNIQTIFLRICSVII